MLNCINPLLFILYKSVHIFQVNYFVAPQNIDSGTPKRKMPSVVQILVAIFTIFTCICHTQPTSTIVFQFEVFVSKLFSINASSYNVKLQPVNSTIFPLYVILTYLLYHHLV